MRTQHYLQSTLEVISGGSTDGEWLLEDGVTVSSNVVPARLLLIYINIGKYHALEAWFLWRISDYDKLWSLRLQIQPLLYMSTDICDPPPLSQKQNKHLIIFIRTLTRPTVSDFNHTWQKSFQYLGQGGRQRAKTSVTRILPFRQG